MVASEPLVSVIVPTCGRANMLPRALDSIMAQDYANKEIVVVNDNLPGSPEDDATEAALVPYVERDAVRVVHTTGRTGGGAARNFACRQASGEYLAFLDDDDEYLLGKLDKQMGFMLANDLEMSYQDIEWRREDGSLAERRVLDHAKGFTRDDLIRAHLRTPLAPTAIYMLRKSLFDRTEGFGEYAAGQDWFLMMRCIEANGKIGYLPGVYVRQYLHKGGRVSVGRAKVEADAIRREYVKRYYPFLSKDEIRYIEFRSNAVAAVSCLRAHQVGGVFGYALKTFFTSPADCFRGAGKMFGRSRD